MSEQYSFYCTKPSDIPCHTQCDLCRKVRYKPVDIPTDQEDRIKMEADQYINLHYTNASVRTAVYWGCIAAARREYLLARRTAVAATQHTETPAPQEVPADVMEWIRKEWLKDSNRHDFRNYEEAAKSMYHKMQEQIATLQAQATNATKDMGKLLEDMGALRDALKLIVQKSQVLKSNPNCAEILDIAGKALR